MSVRSATFKRQVFLWTGLGILIRLALMPFTMHGQDLQYINYFPAMFVLEGAWDPYKFGAIHLPNCCVYYPPAFFLIMSVVNFIYIKVLGLAYLADFLIKSGAMLCGYLGTADYVSTFASGLLYKCLFWLKSPYLLFDLFTGWLLYKLSLRRGCAVMTTALWACNIIVLHSAYCIGQFEIVAAFFIAAALFAGVNRRPYLAVALLSAAGAVKMFPYIFILPAVLLLGGTWKKRFLLCATAGLVSAAFYLPFYLSSGNLIFGSFALGRYYDGSARWILNAVFIFLYGLLLARACRDSAGPQPQEKLIYYFLTAGFLVCAATPISFRYFVFMTPLVALVMPRHKGFAWLIFFSVVLLALVRLPTPDVQLGLLAPLDPAYFDAMPTIQELIGRFMDINVLYRFSARLLVLLFLVCAALSWRMKIKEEEGVKDDA